MVGKSPIQQLIKPDEAIQLFRYACASEMLIAKSLYFFYRDQKKDNGDIVWDFISALSFIYDTGRVQGIREERAKKKGMNGNEKIRFTQTNHRISGDQRTDCGIGKEKRGNCYQDQALYG